MIFCSSVHNGFSVSLRYFYFSGIINYLPIITNDSLVIQNEFFARIDSKEIQLF